MKKTVYTSSIEIEWAVPFGRTKFARNLFGGIGGMVGGGFGVGYGGPGVEFGGTAVNSHELSVTALYFSLNTFVIPEVAAEHSDWPQQQVREEAIHRIERRSADNIKKGYLPELERTAVMTTNWDVIETESGKQLATKNGDKYVTQQELWNNFEQYAKSRGEWNTNLEQEKNAQLAIQTSLVDGSARGAATWLSHASNQARLLQVWERTEDGHIVSRQYDVGRIVGRDLTQREAEQVMHHVSQLYGEHASQSDAAYPHVMTTGEIKIQDITPIAQHDIVTPEEGQHVSIREHYWEAPGELVGESKSLPDEHNVTRGEQKQVDVNRVEPHELPDRGNSGRVHQVAPSVYHPLIETAKTVTHSAQTVAKDSAATVALVGEFVVKKIQERRKKAQKSPRGPEARVADKFSKEMPQKVQTRPTKEKAVVFPQMGMLPMVKDIKRVIEKSERRRGRKKKKRLFGVQHARGVDKILLKHNFVKKEKRGAKPSRVIEMARCRFVFKKDEARIAIKETIVRAAKPVERLWKIVRKLARRVKRLRERHIRNESPQAVSVHKAHPENSTRQQKEIVLSFSFAWSLWALLFLSRIERKQQNSHILIYEKKSVASEGLVKKDPQQWILLAIIWHLAMIREQGAVRATGNKRQVTSKIKVRTKLSTPHIPHAGVIFAFTPVLEHSSVRDFAVALAS